MKRIGNLWERIIDPENLREADRHARKGKGHQRGVQEHDLDREANLIRLHYALRDRTYRTSSYSIFTIREPKERQIFCLPYYPDRIVHWAVMLIVEPVFTAFFTADSYSCIKGRGIHGATRALRTALQDQPGTQFCLKLDIRKFYPSIDHHILKNLLRRKFKDEALLWLLDEIIDSAPGLPIGNYLSQFLANFYLTGLDRWLKGEKGVRYYFRYADDMVILAPDKASLHLLLAEIRNYLQEKLRLQVKKNYQVFPVAARGINLCGYLHYHFKTLLRKSIKQNMARALAKKPSMAIFASYYGWVKHCNGNHLLNKFINETIRRHGDQSIPAKFRRRQDKNSAPAKQGNNRPSLQNSAIDQKNRQQLPLCTDIDGRNPIRTVFRVDKSDRSDRPGS